MIQPWLREIHKRLHEKHTAVINLGKYLCLIDDHTAKGRSVKIGSYDFIVRNLSSFPLRKAGNFSEVTYETIKDLLVAEFDSRLRDGSHLTQINHKDMWYGIIINDRVFGYQGPTIERGPVFITSPFVGDNTNLVQCGESERDMVGDLLYCILTSF